MFQLISDGAVLYTDLTHKRLEETGFYENTLENIVSDQVGARIRFLNFVSWLRPL